MADLILESSVGPVIRVGGQCYEFASWSPDPVTDVPGDVFSNCQDCQSSTQSSTYSSEQSSTLSSTYSSEQSSAQSSAPSSESSSIAPAVCPTNCTSCPALATIVVSGIPSQDCGGGANCADANDTYTYWASFADCHWAFFSGGGYTADIWCQTLNDGNKYWVISINVCGNELAFVRPASACPLGTYTNGASLFPAPKFCSGGTAVVSAAP
jgi:hypothetical protein